MTIESKENRATNLRPHRQPERQDLARPLSRPQVGERMASGQTMHCYTVFKLTGTHADTMAAIGAAGVLRDLGPRIVELEDRFEIRLSRRLRISDLDGVGPGFSYLERPKKMQTGPQPTSRRRRATT